MYYMPVDVIATFNVQGKIKPNYIRLEDENHALQTYRIENIVFCKEENFAGVPAMVFCCNVQLGECLQMINIKYHIKTHQWVLVNEREASYSSSNSL